MVNGKMISHHMNPLTGKPLQSTIVSATVIAKTAMEADALDNYFMSLTPKEAIRFANKRKDVEVYIVCFEDNTFRELQSSGFINYIY
jgi:thiamine biosynthesis lipoprotein